MKKTKLVLIGNGMAGVRTVEELLKIAPDLYDITVFGAEPHPNYNRILLSPVLAGEMTLDDIVLNDLAWYEANGITPAPEQEGGEARPRRRARSSPRTARKKTTTGCCLPPDRIRSCSRCPGAICPESSRTATSRTPTK